MNKFKVFWWIRSVGGKIQKQGSDIIETELKFFEKHHATDIMQRELDDTLTFNCCGRFPSASAKCEEEDYIFQFQNFVKINKKINENVDVSNWGVRKIEEIKG